MNNNSIFIPDSNFPERIFQYIEETGTTQAYLARKMNMLTPNLARILKRDYLETKWLYAISSALGHNFFAELCNDQNHVKEGFILVRPNIGENIAARLKEKRMRPVDVSSDLGITLRNVFRIFKKTSIDIDLLRAISRLLKYNFFQDFYTTEGNSEIVKEVSSGTTGFLDRYEQLVLTNDALKKENIKLRSELYEIQQRLSAADIKV